MVINTALLPYRPCVGIMLVNAAGQVFVGQRSDSTNNAWQMPQGGIDAGETSEQAALRELHEETGLFASDVVIQKRLPETLCYDLPADLQARLWSGQYRGQCQHWFKMGLVVSDDRIDIHACASPEFSAWRWVNAQDLPNLAISFKKHIYQTLLETLINP